jgi:PilZ domain
MAEECSSSLEAGGIEPVPSDRREAERFPFEPGSAWCAVRDDRPDEAPASVRDISMTGIALLVKEPLRPGSVLVISLQNQALRLTRLLPIRVMHATQTPDDGWILGCQFVRKLTYPELQALLGGSQFDLAD